jgi:hypothetical protein
MKWCFSRKGAIINDGIKDWVAIMGKEQLPRR